MRVFIQHTKLILTVLIAILCLGTDAYGMGDDDGNKPVSNKQQALAFLDSVADLEYSKYWPNIEPTIFLQNLRNNVNEPLKLYEGRNTNFCGYAALSYIPLNYDPLTYVRFMLRLYKNGGGRYGRTNLWPSVKIRRTAGTLQFKGELDIRPADQMWFLTLADHFKDYVNILDHDYDPGDEDRLWAAVNYSKFNRMVKRLFNYHVRAAGSDLIRPSVRNLFNFLRDHLKKGTVVLYVNNLFLYKKNHTKAKFNVPTHFIVLLDIAEVDGMINFTYWDYGGITLQQVSKEFLQKIVFGISLCTQKEVE